MQTQNQQPVIPLAQARHVEGLPEVLESFYASHEGVGLESDPEWCLVRLCTLEEVKPVRWSDLHLFGEYPPEVGWEDFSGYRLGMGRFFEEVILISSSPVCPAGSILTLGVDVTGPGGEGPNTLEGSLVLATDFQTWLQRLRQDDWVDYGLGPGGIKNLPPDRAAALKQHFRRLNSKITWA
jgi:hypothetical protein